MGKENVNSQGGKEMYKLIVELYYDKENRKHYKKGDLITNLSKDKAEMLLKEKIIENVEENKNLNSEVSNAIQEELKSKESKRNKN